MTSQPVGPGWKCSECGAEILWPQSAHCWLCGGTLRVKMGEEEAVPAIVLDGPPSDRRAAFQATISTVLLLLTLTAVLAGISVMAPGLGVFLAFFTLPALILSGTVLAGKKRRGQQVGTVQRVGVFVHSLGLIIVVVIGTAIAGAVALFIVCLAGAGFFALK